MSSVAFLLDAPTALATPGEGDQGPVTSQHPVARLGEYKDRRYGEFAITRADYVSWVRNMRELQNGRIPIDYDHAPEEGGARGSEAAGWITSLELKLGRDIDITGLDPDAEYALATIEWTPDGADAVRSRRYLFVSPTFSDTAFDEQQNATGPYLHGVALTNRPFLRRGMPAISLSQGLDDMPCAVAVSSDTPAVPETKTLRATLKLDDSVSDDDVIAAAVKELQARPESTPTEDKRTLKERAEAEGLTVLTAAEVTALRETADQGAEALKQLKESRFDTAYSTALQEGRVDAKPETRERFTKLYELDADTTVETLKALPQAIKLNTTGAETGDQAAPEGVDQDRYELDIRAKAIAADKRIPYSEALSLAIREGAN